MSKQASNTPNQEATGARGNSVAGITVKTKFEPTESQRVIGSDTFSYYSNKLNLTKALRFQEDEEQVIQSTSTSISIITSQGPVKKRRKGSTAHPIQVQDRPIRQTRISYEAHPNLLIYDDILSMLERMDCADISDDDDEEESSEEISDDATSKNEKKRPGVSRNIRDLYLGV